MKTPLIAREMLRKGYLLMTYPCDLEDFFVTRFWGGEDWRGLGDGGDAVGSFWSGGDGDGDGFCGYEGDGRSWSEVECGLGDRFGGGGG